MCCLDGLNRVVIVATFFRENRMSRIFFGLALAGLLSVASGSALRADTVGGAGFANEAAAARETVTYKVFFHGSKTAIVSVTGDGDTDLDLYVYDESGNLVGSDTSPTDRCVVTWIPKWTGQFTIKVVNRGTVLNNYKLRTN